MRAAFVALALLLLTNAALAARVIRPYMVEPRLTALVDPFIGTGGHGHTFPGPSLPFGMVQVGPDTRLEGWDGCSGYHHSDTLVYGFSHTHLSGTGIPDYCDVLLMPGTGTVRLNNGADGRPGYRARFSHARERAEPGYYFVELPEHGIQVELTSTERAAMHRWAFPTSRDAHVVLDLTHRDEVLGSSIRFVGDRTIEGMRRSRSWARDQHVYFVIRFSQPWRSAGIARGDTLVPGRDVTGPQGLKAWAEFGRGRGLIMAKVGISAVDVDGARRNLDSEIPDWDFDRVRHDARGAWERELAKIEVEGGTRAQRRTFYTALYHCLLAPNVYSDVDSRYRGRDGKIHRAGSRHYTVFSLWDTFRALHPLLTITHRARTTEFIQTFLRQYREGGRLPVWELAANETDCMIGYHSVPVIADAIAKGIGGFDTKLALDAMVHSADEDRRGLASYKRGGFVAGEEEGESVSKTLEYAYDDWCIAETARRLGRDSVETRFLARAHNWRNLFDPRHNMMRARLWGHWFAPFDPRQVNAHYTEGNAWQYSWFVPHDVEGLIRYHGGAAEFTRHLDEFFTADPTLTGNSQPDVTGLIGQYAHGNEPSHHVAYLYAFAGQPWKTQALVHRIRDSLYTDQPDGLSGNEDCGQMSAWYVLSALGFYPVTPGTDQYVLGTPLFDRATIRLENGRSFTIAARRAEPGAFHVRGVTVNGRSWPNGWLSHETIARGGTMEFDLVRAPDKLWATRSVSRPRASLPRTSLPPLPYVARGDGVFRDSTIVELGCAEPGARIMYRLGVPGGAPAASYPTYTRPIVLRSTMVLNAFAPGHPMDDPPMLDVTFHRLDRGRTIRLSAKYNAQYAAGGDDALIDGLRGGNNFRDGRWQGYQGTDLDAIVDLGKRRPVQKLSMRFLQDAWPWIFMPRLVEYATSLDGRRWKELGAVENTLADDVTDVTIRDFTLDVAPVEARYVRARIHGAGPLPAWHPGRGSPSFFFTDELEVQ